MMHMASTSFRAGIAAHISPMHVQPIIEFGEYWKFEAPVLQQHHRAGTPRWETRISLDGFSFETGESATVLLTTNAISVEHVAE